MCTKRRFAWRLPRAAAAARYARLAYSRTAPTSCAKWWLGLASSGIASTSATIDADLVDGACRRGAPSDARGRSRRCGHGGGRSGRLSTLHQCSPADGLSRPGAERTFVWEHCPARRDYQGRQCASRVLIEGAWTYRMSARVSRKLHDRLEPLSAAIRDIAWKAQVRLCARYRRLAATGKPKVVVTTAIAREMVGFIWAIARVAQPELT